MTLVATVLEFLTAAFALGSLGISLILLVLGRKLIESVQDWADRIEAQLNRIESTLRDASTPSENKLRGGMLGPVRHRVRSDEPGPSQSSQVPVLIRVPDVSVRSGEDAPQTEAARRATAAADLARRFTRVWELAETGTPITAIAHETGQPTGEIELLLNLRRRLADRPGISRSTMSSGTETDETDGKTA